MKVVVKGKECVVEDLVIRGVDVGEQELIVNAMRDEEFFTVYTSDNIYLTKLKKLVTANPKEWEIIQIVENKGNILGVKFKAPKKLLSFRTATVERTMTDEQRVAAAERLKAARDKN